MAARGYAVLVPNTRGRGGYGTGFLRGMRDGHSAGRLPFEDAMAGVDLLIERGVSNPNQLGVYGHSYGGYLTSYAITQTQRFKAAVDYEGIAPEWFSLAMVASPGTDWGLLARDLYGIVDPSDPAERARLIAESPGLNMDHVTTPTLLVFGAESLASTAGAPLAALLERFNIPSEFLVYDEGHGFARPAAVADALIQTEAWMDKWVLTSRDRDSKVP
jgi:dipeptidyl aminopeptidase/acylaminoacyl peptidase